MSASTLQPLARPSARAHADPPLADPGHSRAAKATAQTLARGLEVLRLINLQPGARIHDLATATGLNRVIVARLVATLVDHGYVVRQSDGAGYAPAARTLALSDGFVGEAWITEMAAPVMRETGAALGWPLSLSVIEAGAVLVRFNTDHANPFTLRKIPMGYRLPLDASASGLVMLAFASPARRALMLALADGGATGAADHARPPSARQLAEIRRTGCAVWQSRAERVVQAAVPVLVGEEPVAALAVRCFSRVVAPRAAVARYRAPLRAAAAKIADALTGRADAR